MQVNHKMDPSKFQIGVEEVNSISNPLPEDKKEELKSNEKRKMDFFMSIIKEGRIILSILKSAEDKYHSRVRQKFQLNSIRKQIEHFLQPQINARIMNFNKNTI